MSLFLDSLRTFTVRLRQITDYELRVQAASIEDAPVLAVDAFRDMNPEERSKYQVGIPCGQTLKVEEVQP